jgi:hypothetical protein
VFWPLTARWRKVRSGTYIKRNTPSKYTIDSQKSPCSCLVPTNSSAQDYENYKGSEFRSALEDHLVKLDLESALHRCSKALFLQNLCFAFQSLGCMNRKPVNDSEMLRKNLNPPLGSKPWLTRLSLGSKKDMYCVRRWLMSILRVNERSHGAAKFTDASSIIAAEKW